MRKDDYKKGVGIEANNTIVCGQTKGKNAMFGAESVVTHNVSVVELWYDNPARLMKNI